MSIPYRRLDPAKREIRLLEIQSARDINDPVECRLVTARMTEDLEFIAISSLYGDHNETDTVTVGGRPVTLTRHHVQGLKHVRAVFYPAVSQRFQRTPARRPHGAPRWLRQLFGLGGSQREDVAQQRCLRVWLDLVCVNQNDDGEKSRQFTEMRSIYKAAELVVGWLGEKTEHTDAAMSVLADVEDAMPTRWGDPGDREKHPEDYTPTHQWAEPLKHLWSTGADGSVPFTNPAWVGYNDFIQRPFFQRRWILEEVAMARFPTFLIGDQIVPWKRVLRMNRMMEEFKNYPSAIFPDEFRPMIAELPLETVYKLLDELTKREAMEEARLLRETGTSRATSSTRSTEYSSFDGK